MSIFKSHKKLLILSATIVLVLLIAVIHFTPVFQSIGKYPTIKQLPQPHFVTRRGSQLLLDGHPFRFAGANMHWLALEDSGDYTSEFSVRDGFATAKAMGLTVVRSHSLGISVGCANCVEPTPGTFNQAAFGHIDYALMVAREFGIHLIIPLTDNYHYTTGGKHTFTDWFGVSDENQFYSDSRVIGAFEAYIKELLNHVNTYTGVAYKDDPTIMAWETGNELDPPVGWTEDIATYIKSIDAKHLIIDGKAGIEPQADTLTNIDIFSDHYYPMNAIKLSYDASAAKHAGKAFIVGEFQWNEAYGGDPLAQFLQTIQANQDITGDLFWELWPHNEEYGYDSNQVQFTLHYPGDDSTMQSQVSLLRDYAYKMTGISTPIVGVPSQPLLRTAVRTDAGNVLIWQGSVGAENYSIERSSTGPGGPWQTICDRCVTDLNVPWTDSTPATTAMCYRIIPYNSAGTAGTASNIYQANSTKTVIDNLNDWSLVKDHSNDLSFVSNAAYMNNDPSALQRNTIAPSYVTWKQQGMTSFQLIAYFWPDEAIHDFSIYTSSDGKTWKLSQPSICTIQSNWIERIYSLNGLTTTNYAKVVWSAGNSKSWTPAIGEVSLSFN